jgi:hypothetical protein
MQPAKDPVTWVRGSKVEVGFALTANHGGGYSYRLCNKNGQVNEDCFQKNGMKFAGNTSWIQYSSIVVPGGPRLEIPLTKVTKGTYPPESEWGKLPVPACNFCDQAACGDPLMEPDYDTPSGSFPAYGPNPQNVTYYGGQKWIDWIRCGVICAGEDENQVSGLQV